MKLSSFDNRFLLHMSAIDDIFGKNIVKENKRPYTKQL